MEVTGAGLGDIYCKDGTAYTSADLFAAALRQRGQQITVPEELRSAYVTTKAEGGCTMNFKIAETGRRAKGKDRTVGGGRQEQYKSAMDEFTGDTVARAVGAAFVRAR
ncbi:hypothetical protein OG264_01630 [Streptomyces xanthophaeus]|uniref:hypothetical protein n=1 Tax=Streptomyces xanthophaeus TaxID=67385 RepID=UPI003866816A|nr:hypothetical protein OG264_01630 [Streptomyces xanthophaeus]WST64710.1 hypothetical protein OG605_36730 [Streptomyces xanthophaeus]